jgi:outer membrane receptor protein involved in Fe transport
MRSKCARNLLLAGTAAGLLLTVPARAQDGETGASQDDSATQGGVGDIIVTARKRAESTQDVPVAITAVDEKTIEKYDLTSLERLAASTPQFSVGRAGTGSGATLVLRGIGSNTTSIGLEQSVAVVVDSVYYGQGRTINEGFFDLGQIEILKGPQALFFGKNATAGVISMITKNPGDTPEFLARLGYEANASGLTGEAIASGPLSDTFGARIALRASKQFGSLFPNRGEAETWRLTDVATGATRFLAAPDPIRKQGTRDLLGRITLVWKPDSRLTANLKASFNEARSDNPLSNYVFFNCSGGTAQLNPDIPCEKRFRSYQASAPLEVARDIPHGNADGSPGNVYKSWGLTGTVTYELDDHISVTNVANYNWNKNVFKIDANAIAASPVGLYATEDTSYHSFSDELRATSDFGGMFDFMIGGLYQRTKRDYLAWTAQAGLENSDAPEGFRFVGNSKDSMTRGETLAVFGQAILRPVEGIELAGGVRYTHETKKSTFLQPYSNPALVAAGVFLPGVTLTADQSFNNWSPEFTVTWEPSDQVTVYAGYKSAYKSGGFSNSGIYGPLASVDDFTFGPETARGFEAGIKTQLLDRQLRLNVGAFWYKYKNLQIDFFNSPVFAFTTYNAGSAITKGVEADFQFAPRAVPGFEAHGSLNYNKAYYDKYDGAPCWTGQTIAQGCYTTVPRPAQDLSGVALANAPRWTGSLGASYETDVSDALKVSFSADGRYKSGYLPTAFGNPYSRQKEYAVLDAQIRFSTRDDHFQFAIIGKNLTNSFYVNGAQDGPSSGGGTGTVGGFPADQIGYVADPRTITAQITVRY